MFITAALIAHLAASVAIFAASATAMLPHHQNLHKRSPGAVYFCTGLNFTGTCNYQNHAINTCVDLPAAFSAASNGTLDAFGPDQGAECLLMQGHCNANEDYYSLKYPGVADLAAINESMIATSYICLEEFADAAARAAVLRQFL